MYAPAKFLTTLLTVGVWVLSGLCSASVGPVFINPANQVAPVNPTPVDAGLFTTQTVYGFLDFTTTIGNTIMVFSPQSAAAPITEAPKEPQRIVNVVIDTTPVNSVSIVEPSAAIKPTKPAAKHQPEKKASDPDSGKKDIPPVTSSKIVEIKPALQNSEVNVVINTVVEEEHFDTIPNIVSRIEIVTEAPVILSSKVEVYEEQATSAVYTPSPLEPVIISSVVEVISDDEEEQPALVIGNNIGEPEYDFLSRQPSEVVEETYKVINLKPSSKFHLKPRASAEKNKATKRADTSHPTGLVTKLGGTVVKDGITTVHETSVIGTYISGKYAQVLQSTSHIYNNQKANKIHPSPSLRILKTASPSLPKSNKHKLLEPTPAGSINEETSLVPDFVGNSIKNSRKPPTGSGGNFKRYKNRQREQELEENEPEPIVEQSYKRNSKRVQASNRSFKLANTSPRKQYGRSHLSTVSVYSADPTTSAPVTSKRYNSRRNKQQRDRITSNNAYTDNSNSNLGFSRRGYKPKVQPTAAEAHSASTSLYKFKLNRSPGRWQYKTTPKPRVTIRKSNDDEQQKEKNEATPSGVEYLNDAVTPQARSDEIDGLVGSESVASIINDESSTENKIDTPFPLETIKVEISTPPDFKDVYYEIATIKSPYTFQVGSVKNTRYITVTSTYERVLEPTGINEQIIPTATEPLTENILATASAYDKDNNFLDSSVATLPPLYLASDMETPPLETLTETFSTTQTMLKTHILPVIRGVNDSSTQTLVQTYLITRLVTATKTLPPMEAYHFIPSKTLNEFNSHLDEAGSELHLELEFGDDNEEEGGSRPKRVFPPDLDLANIGNDFDLSDVDKSKLEAAMRPKKVQITTPKPQIIEQPQQPNLSPEQLQHLAILRLLNPAAAAQQPLGQVITTSKPVIKLETIYESHIIPIVNGQNTILSTLSKIIGTVTKTEYELGTSTLPALPLPPVQINPLFPSAPQQFALTSSLVIYDTLLTQTESKILKLTFGAKTTQTTIYSTRVVPTKLSSYFTASIQVQATVPGPAFPGYFPAPYNPFPYVG